jgi:Tfp pilus assembly PilM family ATPase
MNKNASFFKFFQRGYSDVLGLDIAGSGAKAVRLRRGKQGVTVVAMDILPPVAAPADANTSVAPFVVPKPLRARYVAMTTSVPGSIVKLLTVPSQSEKAMDTQVNELMGIGESEDYRLAYETVAETRADVKIIGVAMPLQTIATLCQFFPSGTPAPCALEVSGLSSMSAYERGPGRNHHGDCTAVIDIGMNVSMVAFYNKGAMILIRRFDFGSSSILKKIQDSLGVDGEVAQGILHDGSFDISQITHQVMEPFLQQLAISWDFVERRENTHIARLYACGGGAALKCWAHEIQGATGQEPIGWNPFDDLVVAPAAAIEKWEGQEPRFTAALGTALSVLGED